MNFSFSIGKYRLSADFQVSAPRPLRLSEDEMRLKRISRAQAQKSLARTSRRQAPPRLSPSVARLSTVPLAAPFPWGSAPGQTRRFRATSLATPLSPSPAAPFVLTTCSKSLIRPRPGMEGRRQRRLFLPNPTRKQPLFVRRKPGLHRANIFARGREARVGIIKFTPRRKVINPSAQAAQDPYPASVLKDQLGRSHVTRSFD